MVREQELSDTLLVENERESSAAILEAIEEAERAFSPYLSYCRTVDGAYSLSMSTANIDVRDEAFALFWASMEILKPAIYAKPPKPIASPRFKDGGKLEKTTAELMERSLESTFDRGNIDEVMLGARDDLALTNRGVAWVTYETDEKGGGQRVCIEHLDRADFLHEPARKWSEVGWVARRAWMTFTQMKKRFKDVDEDILKGAQFNDRSKKNADYGMLESSAKAGVWEVWSKTDDRVYWVTEGVRVILDEDEPHLNIQGFYPCPKPAYGTLQRRSLVPVPDYKRYSYHLDQVNELTSRIYTLLENVKLKVLIPGGGDVGEAVKTALASTDDQIVITVPAAALMTGAANNLMVTLPLAEIAQTIQGLIEARTQLIEDFYQLSGISDIMRGATEAQETLGAQQLKSQYGSVRVRDKIDELQRLARDVAHIAAEIMAANFSKETLLELSRMTIPTRAEVKRKVKEIEDAAKQAMADLRKEIEDAAEQQEEPIDPQQVQQQAMQRQQEIMATYQPALRELSDAIVIEDVMDMLRDTHGRNLVIDIETDSTILTDEMAEKQSRAEFLNAFTSAAAGTQMLLQAGEAGAKLAGGILKFALQPYRANRELDDLVDAFVDQAPQMAQQGGEGEEQGLAAAQMKLAEAELMKAQAQGENYQAQAQLKMQELELKAGEAQAKVQQDQQKFQLSVQEQEGKIAETLARIEKIQAEIQKMGVQTEIDAAKVQNDTRKTDVDEFRAVSDAQSRQTDQAMRAQSDARNAQMSERQQEFTERNTDRQQTFAERQASREPAE